MAMCKNETNGQFASADRFEFIQQDDDKCVVIERRRQNDKDITTSVLSRRRKRVPVAKTKISVHPSREAALAAVCAQVQHENGERHTDKEKRRNEDAIFSLQADAHRAV